ncbi:MAG: hypothetical protein ACK4UN_00395 [Limisphaerales bacterium]
MMKKTLLVIGLATATQLSAEELTSNVIHDYNQVQINYDYFHDLGNTGVNAHGVGAQFSYEIKNFLFAAEGGYAWGDDDLGINADLSFWNISGSVGYVFRFMGNHLNIIPRFGVGYNELEIDSPITGTFRFDDVTIHPGITASYAITHCWNVFTGYSFDYGIDTEAEGHALFVGTTVALAENIGTTVRAVFREGQGFAGLTAGISFHY